MLIAAASLGVCDLVSAQMITPLGVDVLQRVKAFLYYGLTIENANGVAAGTAEPFVYEQVTPGSLPASYYHFPVKDDQLSAFIHAVGLPPSIELVPVSIVKGTPPRFYITVTVYEAAGERSGLRAEWTSYVRGPGDARPRTLMLDVATSEASLNPVTLQSPPAEVFEYRRTNQTLATRIVSGSSAFSASVIIPAHPTRGLVLDRHWGAAGDMVYWRNGVADAQNFNGLIANRRVIGIPPAAVTVSNQTPWAAFADVQPEFVLLYDQRIDVSLRPWVNADDPALPLDPGFRQELLDTKASAYYSLETNRASSISQGQAEPMADFLLESAPPAIFLNFRIPPEQRDALAAAIPIPRPFHLAPVQPYPGVAKDYYMNLNIYLAAGLAPGFRAEWSVYVTKDGDPNPRFMIVDLQCSTYSIDPIHLITRPAQAFEYSSSSTNELWINIQASNTVFRGSVRIPANPAHTELNLEWAECNSFVYWKNGVADKIYYNETSYGDVALIPVQNVEIEENTPWARYLRLDHVFIYPNPQVFVASPWNNLNDLQACYSTNRLPPARPILAPGTSRAGKSMTGVAR